MPNEKLPTSTFELDFISRVLDWDVGSYPSKAARRRRYEMWQKQGLARPQRESVDLERQQQVN